MSGVARWAPAAVVAIGAAAATAHGLFEVAVASRVPGLLAVSYPLITDGLALVAYSATRRLTGAGARYAWTVVVLAAALSGLAQAVYLAADTVVADPALRFGVGAWPAIAAGLAAHLLHLLVTAEKDGDSAGNEKGVHTTDTPDAAAPAAHEVDGAETATETRIVVEPDPAPEPEELTSPAPSPAPGVGTADVGDIDPRVAAIARRLAAGEELTGPDIAAEHGVSPRTGRRLLGDARAHRDQHARLHLVTRRDTTA